MTKIIVDIFMYIFEAMLFYYYSTSLFEKKNSKFITISGVLLGNMFLFATYQIGNTYLNGICLLVTFLSMFLLLFKISFKTAVFHSLVFLLVMFAAELLVMGIGSVLYGDFNALENSDSAYIFVIVLSKLIYFAIMMIILKLFANKDNNQNDNKYFWLLFVIPFVNILMLIAFRYTAYQVALNPTTNLVWIIACIGSLFANILVFAIYEISQKNTRELYDLKAIQRQEEQDSKYFEVIEKSNNDMRIFAHDIKNHFIQIRNIETKEEANAYIDKLVPNIEKFTYTGISKNKMLDLIINKYMILCDAKNIKLEIDVKTANLNYIDDADLSTLLNNLLDNAIESSEKIKNSFIQINIFSKNELYDGLVIKNSCETSPITKDGILETTKPNRKSHGIGLSSVKKIIKKYDAVYGWKYDESKHIFETDIAFLKSNIN